MSKDRYLQAVRGVAIAAVVLIHCLPTSDFTVAARPFLNWAVATFFFLSGYLTDEAKVARGGGNITKAEENIAALCGVEHRLCLGFRPYRPVCCA